jgi:hypothetical protein
MNSELVELRASPVAPIASGRIAIHSDDELYPRRRTIRAGELHEDFCMKCKAWTVVLCLVAGTLLFTHLSYAQKNPAADRIVTNSKYGRWTNLFPARELRGAQVFINFLALRSVRLRHLGTIAAVRVLGVGKDLRAEIVRAPLFQTGICGAPGVHRI